MLKSATISFGENLVAEDLERAQRGRRGRDVFLAARHVARRLPGRGAARDRAAAAAPGS